MMDKNGENKTFMGASTNAVWSPDGQYIAFLDKGVFDRYQIFLMNADGTQPQPLTHLNNYLTGITWSPDGDYIAFSSYLGGEPYVYIINVTDETEPVLLRPKAAVSDWIP